MLKLVRMPAGSRRERPRDSRKQSDQEFHPRDGEFPIEMGEFASLYSREKLCKKNALPSKEQVIEGMY